MPVEAAQALVDLARIARPVGAAQQGLRAGLRAIDLLKAAPRNDVGARDLAGAYLFVGATLPRRGQSRRGAAVLSGGRSSSAPPSRPRSAGSSGPAPSARALAELALRSSRLTRPRPSRPRRRSSSSSSSSRTSPRPASISVVAAPSATSCSPSRWWATSSATPGNNAAAAQALNRARPGRARPGRDRARAGRRGTRSATSRWTSPTSRRRCATSTRRSGSRPRPTTRTYVMWAHQRHRTRAFPGGTVRRGPGGLQGSGDAGRGPARLAPGRGACGAASWRTSRRCTTARSSAR